MKMILGPLAAALAGAAFALAYYMAVRPGASWIDGAWVFLAAAPYNKTMLLLTGVSNFSPDAPKELVAAGLFDMALAFAAGALIEALARGLFRIFRRRHARA